MKNKVKLMVALTCLLPSSAFASVPTENTDIVTTRSSPFCTQGVIRWLRYNSDKSMSVAVGAYEMYTDHANLQPLLLSAYFLKQHIKVYTTDCRRGGGFATTAFE